ncbi:MAG: hypothetical protein MI919_03140 [Holophagales bacterium]|nr:hypothetical protein [Holophagales bacterium]
MDEQETASFPVSLRPGIPAWYALFLRAHLPAWWLGFALVAGSWVGWVTPMVGWLGFGLACLATLGAWVLPKLVGPRAAEKVVLDSRLLEARGTDYEEVMEGFRAGSLLSFDGCGFRLLPGDSLGGAVVSASSDRAEAEEAVGHARTVFRRLAEQSPEFAAIAGDRKLEVVVLSSYEATARETWRWAEGELIEQRR